MARRQPQVPGTPAGSPDPDSIPAQAEAATVEAFDAPAVPRAADIDPKAIKQAVLTDEGWVVPDVPPQVR